jgi:hypothetical protein
VPATLAGWVLALYRLTDWPLTEPPLPVMSSCDGVAIKGQRGGQCEC